MHHTTPETFNPALAIVYGFVDSLLKTGDLSPQRIEMAGRLLYTVVTARKGGRIKDWPQASVAAVTLLQAATELKVEGEQQKDELKNAVWEVLKAAAMILQQSDLEVAIQKCGKVVDIVKAFQGGVLFLPFCDFFSGLGAERFRVFLLPYFQRFIVSQWTFHEDALCLLIPKLSAAGSLTPSKEAEASVAADLLGPKSPLTSGAKVAIQAVRAALETPQDSATMRPLLVRAWQYLNVLSSLPLSATAIPADIIERLGWLLQKIFILPDNTPFASFVGKALSLYSRGKGSQQKTLCEPLCKSFTTLGANPVFLQGAADFVLLSVFKSVVHEAYVETMADKLITNLATPSHEVRQLSLRCLEVLWACRNPEHQVSEVINTAIVIENTPLTIVNARNVAMYVRRLGSEYAGVEKGSWERRVVPYYCFGLLTVHFAPAWDDAAAALLKVAESEEEMVAGLAFGWLQLQSSEGDGAEPTGTTAPKPWTSFECTNMREVEEGAGRCIRDSFGAKEVLVEMFGEVGIIGPGRLFGG